MNMDDTLFFSSLLSICFWIFLLAGINFPGPVPVSAESIQGEEYLWKIDDGKSCSPEGFDLW